MEPRSKESQWIRWASIRQKGKWRFVITRGMLAYGIPVWCLNHIIGPLSPQIFTWGSLVSLLMWLGAGTWFGLWGWTRNEQRYGTWKSDEG